MGFFKDRKGYPRFKNSGKLVHRAVAENKIGRKLKGHEVVQHRDEDKTNIRKGNLGVVSRSFHSKLHNKKRNRSWF